MDTENGKNHSGLLFQDEGPGVYTVSALTARIRELLETQFDFIWVEGEVSNFSAPSSGHFYMVLKDEKS
ncbi:MAG: exodeoxyribonuclease VII large subunit, partial [Deltaproteobacteria bacterium]|nr:exodeoxyribonuclease VII large subunit [Deltaproteobacteria bacterium]